LYKIITSSHIIIAILRTAIVLDPSASLDLAIKRDADSRIRVRGQRNGTRWNSGVPGLPCPAVDRSVTSGNWM